MAISLLAPCDAEGRLIKNEMGELVPLTPADAGKLLEAIELGGMGADDFLVPVELLESLHVNIEAWNRLGIKKVHDGAKFDVAADLAQWGILPVLESWSGRTREELHTIPQSPDLEYPPLAR